MLKPNPQIAEFVCGVKAAAERVEAAICNLDAVVTSGVPDRLWGVADDLGSPPRGGLHDSSHQSSPT